MCAYKFKKTAFIYSQCVYILIFKITCNRSKCFSPGDLVTILFTKKQVNFQSALPNHPQLHFKITRF